MRLSMTVWAMLNSRSQITAVPMMHSETLSKSMPPTNMQLVGPKRAVLALDPGMPGIGAKERYQRARNILSNIADDLSLCSASERSEHPESLAKMVEARAALSEKKRPASFSDTADATIALAIDLWKARLATCAAPSGDSPLQRIMAKLTTR